MDIAVIGTGYVGLVSGLCFAHLGHRVTAVDLDAEKVELLQACVPTIYESGLKEMLVEQVNAKRITFTVDLKKALSQSEIVVIAVGTPTNQHFQADLSYINQAIDSVLAAVKHDITIVIKSTVPVGTNHELNERVKQANLPYCIDIVSNPEFLREGSAIVDFLEPDRIVVGTLREHAKEQMALLYKPLTNQGVPILWTDLFSAELIKYGANAFLATKITFINELAQLCEKTGASITDVACGMGMDRRIGNLFLKAGPGYGGSCFPKDTLALVQTGQDFDARQTIVESVIEANEKQKQWVFQKINTLLNNDLRKKRIALWGITFKANTDDIRDATALTLVPQLIAQGVEVIAYDPQCENFSHPQLEGVKWAGSPLEAAKGADLVCLLTDWDVFLSLDLEAVVRSMRTAILLDCRNAFSINEIKSAGFLSHASVGRASYPPKCIID